MNYKFSSEPVKVKFVNTKHRLIHTLIPTPGTKQILECLGKYEPISMQGSLPIIWDCALGHSVFDMAGNKWIDFTSTIFVANIGHGNPHVAKYVKEYIDKPLFHSYCYPTKIRMQYIRKLIEYAGDDFEKAFLLSSGTEATECALKLMRIYGQKKQKHYIICIEGNYHGRTMGSQMMSNNYYSQREWIGFQDPYICYIPFPYPWVLKEGTGEEFFINALKNLSTQISYGDICGFMLETFQGWGAIFYPKDFVQKIREMCDRFDALLVFDEMQSGFGRTGKKFGYEHYDVKADIICCGKGMSSGFPLSGVLSRSEIFDLPEVGNIGSTHSANPLVCAAGLATLEEIESRNIVEESARKGIILHCELNKIAQKYNNQIMTVQGKGLIAALIFNDDNFASRIVEKCMQKGLLVVHTGTKSMKIAPPLTITDDALLEGISVIDESIKEIK